MNRLHAGTDRHVPDGIPFEAALSRVTHAVVGAHQDDVEFMGFPLIQAAFHVQNPTFGAVVLTDGAGSPRSGVYAECSDEDMQRIRRREQRLAADIGRYAVVVQLGYPSRRVKDEGETAVLESLAALLQAMRPRVLMTHTLADKHDTHVATALRVISALRRLPPAARPQQLLGGEIWRGLDWLPDREKLTLDAGGNDSLAAALMGVFDSQIAGGKRYDLATFGRRRANATYGESHAVDAFQQVAFAMDLTPLIQDDTLDPMTYMMGYVERFAEEIRLTFGRAGYARPSA